MAARSHLIDGRVVETKCTVAREIWKTWCSCNHEEAICGRIKEDTKEHHLRNYASNMEKVVPFEIITDRQSGKKRGIGFIILMIMILWIKLYCGNTIPSSMVRSKKVFVQTRNAENPKF